MTSPAPNPGNLKLQRPRPRFAVLLGQPGQPPTLDDQVDWLIPVSIERSAGGKQVDSMLFRYDLGKRNERIVDVTAPIGYDREVEVVELDEDGEIRRTVGWGKIGVQPTNISQGEESLNLRVRMDHHLFGDVIVSTPYWDEIDSDIKLLSRDWIFNPEIDEKVEPNRSSHQDEPDRDEAYLFVDPESLRTPGAESYQGQQAYLWDIPQAAHRLCWRGNRNEPHIKNPKRDEIDTALAGLPQSLLQNHKIKTGLYLPKALDDLLDPYGCNWFVAHELDETDPDNPERIRKLRFFKDGQGTDRKFYMQRPGQRLEPPRTNVEALAMEYSIVDLANEIEGQSSLAERELTFPIFPLWPEADDSIDIDELRLGTETNKEKPNVGRKFGINTDGSYNELRSNTPHVSDVMEDLRAILGEECIPRRHVLKPCLSRVKNEEGEFESRGYHVEWYNPDAEDGPTWEQVTCSIHRSDKEAVVFLGSEKVHEGIWTIIQDDPTSLQMRITCTFTSDLRVYKTATRQATSPNADTISLFLDLSDKFHDRRVDPTSIFFFDGSAEEVTNADTEMEPYLEHIRSIDDCAEVGVTASLEGLDRAEYEIGQVITDVEGRNLSLDANASTSGTPRRLQILGITLDFDANKTELKLETIQGGMP